jgi:hypothetical protein
MNKAGMEDTMNRMVISERDLKNQPVELSIDQLDSRPVVRGSRRKEKRAPVQTPDHYGDRLIKYIPAEVVILYLTLQSMLQSIPDSPSLTVSWGVFGFGILATFLHLSRIAKVTKKRQILISLGAFVVWAFALGGPFQTLSWYQPAYGGMLLCCYTFLVPIIEA